MASALLVVTLLGCSDDDGLDTARLESKAEDGDMAATQQPDLEALAAVCQSVGGLLTFQDSSFRCVLPQAATPDKQANQQLPEFEAGDEEEDAGLPQPDAGTPADAGAPQPTDAGAPLPTDAGPSVDGGRSCPTGWGWLCGIQAGSENGNGNGNGNGS
ncbi:MAG TPA: hypothetical protein VI299_24440, partial [Polyangiales bacterium]